MYLCIPYIPLAKLTVLNISSMSSLRQCFLTASQMCWMKAEPYVSWVYEPVSASKQNQIISVVRRCLIVINVTYWRVVHLQVVLEWKMMKSFSLCVRGPLTEFTDGDSMSSVGTNCFLSSKSADSSPTETNTQTYWNVLIFYLFKWTNINSKFIHAVCWVCEDRWESPPLQAWIMTIFGLSFSAGQFFEFKCWKIWSSSNSSVPVLP